MRNIKVIIAFFVLLFLGDIYLLSAQNHDYDFENWKGKNNPSKNNMQIPDELITNYGMKLISGSNGDELYFRMPSNENDTYNSGRIQIGVFRNSMDAKLRLLDFLNELNSPNKLLLLSRNDFIKDDIAFGNVSNETSIIVFAKNNVLVIIIASTKKANEITIAFEKIINNAPNWIEGNSPPVFQMKIN